MELSLFLVLDRSIDGLVGRPLYTCQERAATSLSFSKPARLQNGINGWRSRRRPLMGFFREATPRQRPSCGRGIEREPDGRRCQRRGRVDRPRGHPRHAADCLDRRPKTAVFRHEPGRCIAAGRETRTRCVNRPRCSSCGGTVGKRQHAEQNQKRRRARADDRKPRRRPVRPATGRRNFAFDGPTQNHATLPMQRYTDWLK